MGYLYNIVRVKHPETVVCVIHRTYPSFHCRRKITFYRKVDLGKKIANSILTAARIVLQATELSFSAKTVMPFYGFRRAGEGMPINTSNSWKKQEIEENRGAF